MAEFNAFYQRAYYYDIVFRRDVTVEIDFVCAVYKQQRGSTPQSLLDLACGPGYHARNFAGRGLRAVGLDLRPEMVQFAAEQEATDGVQGVEWLAADMRDFKLVHPVDVAINVFDGIDCLNSNADLIAHLRAVADNLTEGGLYFIDVTHPRFTNFSHYERFHYQGERDGVRVQINWAINQPQIDPVTSVSRTQLELLIEENGSSQRIEDTAYERVLTAQEILLLAQLSGKFEIIGWYGAYDTQQPPDYSPAATRLIAVLQKQA